MEKDTGMLEEESNRHPVDKMCCREQKRQRLLKTEEGGAS